MSSSDREAEKLRKRARVTDKEGERLVTSGPTGTTGRKLVKAIVHCAMHLPVGTTSIQTSPGKVFRTSSLLVRNDNLGARPQFVINKYFRGSPVQ